MPDAIKQFCDRSIDLFGHRDKSVTVLRRASELVHNPRMLENDPLAAFWMPFTANKAFKAHPRPGAPTKRATELFHACFDNGLLVRATGDIIALSPPLILEKAHIDEMFGTIGDLLAGIG